MIDKNYFWVRDFKKYLMVFVLIYFTVFLFYVESRISKKFAEFTNFISMKKCVQFFERNILFIKINGKNCLRYFP